MNFLPRRYSTPSEGEIWDLEGSQNDLYIGS